MRPKSPVLAMAILAIFATAGCRQSNTTLSSGTSSTTSKTDASPEGVDKARRDVDAMKPRLKAMSPEELIASFISQGGQRYGGYEYYYNSMTNAAIRQELESRGETARQTLERHANDSTRIFEGVNAPNDTVGSICRELIGALGNRAT